MAAFAMNVFMLALAGLHLLSPVHSVERHKFKTCHQSGFCRRSRAMEPGQSEHYLEMPTLTASGTSVEVVAVNAKNGVQFRLEIFGLKDATFRFRLREAFPLMQRFEVPEVLVGDPEQEVIQIVDQSEQGFTVVAAGGSNSVNVSARPFKMDFYSEGVLTLSANARSLLKFEHTRTRKEAGHDDANEEVQNGAGNDDEVTNDATSWDETFGGNTDSKPRGPNAVAMDFTFPDTDNVYGIPEHAEKFSLPDTSSGEPYRLYNLDVFEYELWNSMALYASIPFMIGHNKQRTTGLFWMNAAETWVDVKKSGQGVLDSLSNLMGAGANEKKVETHWMSEAGIIDVFVMLGPKPKDVSRQYSKLTGPTPLPPLFSIAYHQCRWNYNDQDDVASVANNFDLHDIPMDVMWLDIEHTDGKKYFTWDERKFSQPLEMIQNLTAVGRKLVTISDPHIKEDSNYWVHKDLTQLGLYVKTKDGADYQGWCWPGASYYPDFLNPEAREYFSEQYMLSNYKGSSLDLYTWNDMNEPSVFNGPEMTMPKDLLHMGGWEHRDLHNIYGHLFVMATHEGHLRRSERQRRPFILTRSGFAGTQRYAAIWTGDNTADWGHLQASVPMCLSLSVTGMAFCGADVGGFFKHPSGDMFVRWYQAAAFQPFFRSHAHIDTRRREPWLFSTEEMKLIRQAIAWRYSLLPLWYTLFYETELTGVPPMRPLWYEFPEDENTFAIDNQHMVGEQLLVYTVSTAGQTDADVYLPAGVDAWYDYFGGAKYSSGQTLRVALTAETIPVFQRAGTIIPKKERARRSSALMANDPYTLIVALDGNASAQGALYIDDGLTYGYKQGQFLHIDLRYENNQLTGTVRNSPKFTTKSWLERVVIRGLSAQPRQVTVVSPVDEPIQLGFTYYPDTEKLIIRRPGINIGSEFHINLAI